MAAVVAAAVLTGGATEAHATPPPGFSDSKVLEPPASFVARKQARVSCAKDDGAWATLLYSTGRAGASTNGSSVPGSAELRLSAKACKYLRAKNPPLYSRAASLEQLRALMAQAWKYREGASSAYRTVC